MLKKVTLKDLDLIDSIEKTCFPSQEAASKDSLKENEVNGFVLTCKDHLIPFYESCGFRFKGVSKSVHGNAKWNDMVRINERER